MSYDANPFPNDPDRRDIWDFMVRKDIDAYLAKDWSMVAGRLLARGLHGRPGRWFGQSG